MITSDILYNRLKNIEIGGGTCRFSPETCDRLTPQINRILALKTQKNAVILAHSYVAPEITYGVADFVGDSYELSKFAKQSDAETIVFCAVRFMGETAKILSPEKEVLIPAKNPGCSLADSITADDVRLLRLKHPDHTFVCYINTSAEVKALCDVCVTSSNVTKVITAIPNDKIVFLPDKLMGQNVQAELDKNGIKKKLVLWHGTCYVHETYDPEMIQYLRLQFPEMEVITHPECSPAVVAHSDYVGSTTQMFNYISQSTSDTFLVLTECGITQRLSAEIPGKRFVGSCTMCKYMRSNTLDDVERVLTTPQDKDRVILPTEILDAARHCIEQMFVYAESMALV